jgi:ribose 5-phosphate isomerase B
MKLSIAADHAGFAYKEDILKWLAESGHEVIDFGTDSERSCDYPDFAFPAAEAVILKEVEYAILICGTGTGMAITANRIPGIRAANCLNPEMAVLARSHNDANALAMGSRLISIENAKEIIKAFLETPFEGGRHERRIDKIHDRD